MRGTVLKLRSKNQSYLEDEGDEVEEVIYDAPDSHSTAHKSFNADLQHSCELQQNVSASILAQNERKMEWMSTLDLNSVPSSLHSSPWQNNSSKNNPTSSCHQPSFSWNGPAMWKAMAKHPLFPQFMELQAKLMETFETIQSDCKKAACEKALTSLYMNASTPVKSHPSSSVLSVKKQKNRWNAPSAVRLSAKEDESPYQLNSRKAARSLRSSPNHTLLALWHCGKCAKPFSGMKWLQKHQAICNALPERKKCKICHRTFKSRKWLEKHETLCSASISSRNESDPQESFKETSNQILNKEILNETLIKETFNQTLDLENLPCEDLKNEPCDGDPINSQESSLKKNGGSVQTNSASPTKKEVKRVPSIESQENDNFVNGNDFMANKASGFSRKVMELSDDYSIKGNMDTMKTSGNQKYLCIGCLDIIRSASALDNHQSSCIKRKSGSESNRCNKCSFYFATENKLLKHQVFCCPTSDNKMIKWLTCGKCSKVFTNRKKQIKHRALCCPDSETESMVCGNCFCVFLKKELIIAHKAKCGRSN